MRYRQLGASDIEVSEISLGSWLTYGGGVEREQAEGCVEAAFAAGINFIDTANVYSRGRAEEFLGEVLAGRPRDSYVLATKLYFPIADGPRALDARRCTRSSSSRCGRLRTDYVDLYQCHRYDDDDAARGDDGGAQRGRPRGQGAGDRLQRVDGGADRGRARAPGRRALRLEPAAVLDAPPRRRSAR